MNPSLKELTRARASLVGTTLCLPGAGLAELLAEPFDVVWIDLEHGALGAADALEMIVGAQAAGTFAMVRVPADEVQLVSKMLDAAADGVVLANVRSAELAARTLAHVSYPPAGLRGYGPRRVALRGRNGEAASPSPAVWIQIESDLDERELQAIASLDQVDAVVVGTADLSHDVGSPLQIDSPAVKAAVERVAEAADGADKAFGIAGALDEVTLSGIHPASILILGTDARVCANAVDTAARAMRASLGAEREGTVR